MKNVFKFLSVGVIALTTLFSSGCSCSINKDKTKVAINKLSNSKLVYTNNSYKGFTATVEIDGIDEDGIASIEIDHRYEYDFNGSNTEPKLIEKNLITEEETNYTATSTENLKDEFYDAIKNTPIVLAYDKIKEIPFKVYNALWTEDANQKAMYLIRLWGLEEKLPRNGNFTEVSELTTQEQNIYNSIIEFTKGITPSASAKKKAFGNDITYTFSYMKYKHPESIVNVSIKTNSDNKITYALLTLTTKGVNNTNKEQAEYRTRTLAKLTINYK